MEGQNLTTVLADYFIVAKSPAVITTYLLYIALGTTERVRSTFAKKRFAAVELKSHEAWFAAPFYSYLILVGLFVAEFLFLIHVLNLWITAVGLFIYFTGVWLRRRAIADLGDNWSLHTEIRTGHKLVTHGIYRRLKHPYYLAVLCELLGASLVGNSFYTAALVLLTQGPLLIARIRMEEGLLSKYFGDRYRDYAKGRAL